MNRRIVVCVSLISFHLLPLACGHDPSKSTMSVGVTGTTALQVGQTAQWSAVASFTDNSSESVTERSSWSSNNPAVASVVGGLVRALAPGSAEVSASFQEKVGRGTVMVAAVKAVQAAFRVTPYDNSPGAAQGEGNCAVRIKAGGGLMNEFLCTFDATMSTSVGGTITTYSWEIPVGGITRDGASLPAVTYGCAGGSGGPLGINGGLAAGGGGSIPLDVRLTVTATNGTDTLTRSVTFIRGGAC
jgi:Big-like domain-containing protein